MVAYARRMKPSWAIYRGQKPFIVMENRLTKQMNELIANNLNQVYGLTAKPRANF